ncbi:hypothetical protein T484DRAFT_1953558 [Baffinella frigidus]|nr:hypothetical protein T484DRAFT_1953558 [Cryptophyta sp. CCMP2293]
MFGITKMAARALLVLCVLAAAEGATVASRAGFLRAPVRVPSSSALQRVDAQSVTDSSPRGSLSGEASGPAIAGGHGWREMGGLRAMQRSTSHTRRLNSVDEVHASHDNSVYAAPVQRCWSKTPVMAPPLRTDRPYEEYTYIKTKLYPHMSF